MASISSTVNLQLNEVDTSALKKVLGTISDVSYREIHKLSAHEMSSAHEIYNLLPLENEED